MKSLKANIAETLDDKISSKLSEVTETISNNVTALIKLETKEILSSVQEKIDNRVGPLEAKIEVLEATTSEANLEKKIVEIVERKVESLPQSKTPTSPESPGTKMRNTISGVSAEIEEKKRRSKNIIIHGLPEDNSSKDERVRKDTEILDDIIRVTLGVNTNKVLYDNVTRLGRDDKKGKRPLLVTLPTNEIKEEVFSKRQRLRDSKYRDISLKHDMTPL